MTERQVRRNTVFEETELMLLPVTRAPGQGESSFPAAVADDVRELSSLQSLLEGHAAALAACSLLSPSDLSYLEYLQRITFDPDDASTVRRFLEGDTEFHQHLGRMAGNDQLSQRLASVLEELERYYPPNLSVSSAEEIVRGRQVILQAVKSMDPDESRQAVGRHVRSLENLVLKGLSGDEWSP